MEEERSHVKYYSIKLGIFVVLAVLVFVFREQLVENLKYFIGGLMLLYGLEELVFELIYNRHHLLHQEKLYLGFIEIMMGAILLAVNMSYESICIVWATWSIMREAYEIKEVLAEMKCFVPRFLSGAESLVVIIFSILLIITPTEHHAMIHLYLLLAELPLAPLTPLLDEVLDKKK